MNSCDGVIVRRVCDKDREQLINYFNIGNTGHYSYGEMYLEWFSDVEKMERI